MNPGSFILPLLLGAAAPRRDLRDVHAEDRVVAPPRPRHRVHRRSRSWSRCSSSATSTRSRTASSSCSTPSGFPGLGAHFKTGIDGISVFLVILTTFLMPLTLLGTAQGGREARRASSSRRCSCSRPACSARSSRSICSCSTCSWEVMLIPMYLLIGIWGGQRRLYASIKFVIYTMVGSLLMLVAIFYVYVAGAARCSARTRRTSRSC